MKMKQFSRTLALVAVVLTLGLTAQAGTVYPDMDIIVTFTADADIFGFVNGQEYTVVYTVNGSYEENPYDGYGDAHVIYEPESSGDSPLWNALGGTALSGTYVFPDAHDPFDFLNLQGGEDLTAFATSDTDADLGVDTPDGSAVTGVSLWATLPGLMDSLSLVSNQFINPADLLSDCVGTWSGDLDASIQFNWASQAKFDVTQVQIAPTAGGDPVPEPATLSLLGLGLAGLAARRLRRK